MKYQKSMMKIMENLFLGGEKSIEKIISETKTGRNSAFDAINWLEKYGFVKIRKSGKIRLVSLVVDNSTLQFKYYLDSVKLKSLNPLVKVILGIFSDQCFEKKRVKCAVLFGSAMKERVFKDIDILILGDSINSDFLRGFYDLREKIERVFGVIINLHSGKFASENVLKGIVFYQSSYFTFRDEIKDSYLESFDWVFQAIKNQKSSLYKTVFGNACLNLAYVYSYLKGFRPETKSDALKFFGKKYNVNNLSKLKKVEVEIGKELFK